MKTTLINKIVFSVFVFISILTTAQDTTQTLKTINGQITSLGAPIPNVNILITKTTKGTKTDGNGNYTIQAKVGDVIQYSHVSFKTISIVVEDITSTLNIEMKEKTNQLDEAVVTARKKVDPIDEMVKRMDVELDLPIGTINPYRSGFAINYLEGEKINQASPTLISALDGKFAGVRALGLPPDQILTIRDKPATFIINGIAYGEEPPVLISQIKDIFIIKNRAMVVIVLDDAPHIKKIEKEKIAEKHRNQNYYNNDAVSIKNDIVSTSTNSSKNKQLRTISGKITHLDAPLPDVNIKVKGRTRGTKTNRKGHYELKAKTGEIIEYSYVGFKSVSIIVEDITKELNIDMITEVNELDEVVVTIKTIEGETLKRNKKANKKFNTSRGNIDPRTAGYSVGFIDGDEVSNTYSSIKDALVGKIAGYSVDGIGGKAYLRGKNSSVTQDYPVAWEVDGNFTQEEPLGLDLSQIENVYALKSLAATNKYGTLGAGGVIVITTKYGNYQPINKERQKNIEKHQNKNFYNNDAVGFNSEDSNVYTETLKAYNDIQDAFAHYDDVLKYDIQDYPTHISIAKLFHTHYANPTIATQILFDLSKSQNNPEILKAIAYQLDIINANHEAAKVYEAIFKLRPKYAQSYRDLANAYHENDQYKKSWRLYMSYLMQGHDVSNEGIGNILYNEMEYLYFNRQNQTQIKEKFVPKNETIEDFRNDVRMVFEWNTSEAEFELEFVSPDKRAYVFNHSLEENQELITDEKTKGYSSKEFIIEAIGNGEWLVNITYRGNKKPEPTYFKVTSYYHWGKSNQTKETSIYSFKNEREKIQLKKINKQSLLVSK